MSRSTGGDAFFPNILGAVELKTRTSRLHEALGRVIETQNWSEPQIRDWHETSVIELVRDAFKRIPFYREKYDRAGFDPDTLCSRRDFTRIPILTKDELRQAPRETLVSHGDDGEHAFVQTSGSTGVPVGLFVSRDALEWFTAVNTLLYYRWCDAHPLTNVLFILDSKPHNIDYLIADQLRTTVMEDRFLPTSEHTSILAEALRELEPEYLSSYPGTVRNLARYMIERGETGTYLRLIHLTSEMLDESARNAISQAFPEARLIETYTSTEAGFMGFECPTHGGFHLAEHNLFIELPGDDSNRGKDARLLVTDLVNRATPIIRYSGLGDILVPSGAPCACGNPLRHIRGIEGRQVDSILLEDGSWMSPYALTNIPANHPAVAAYQIIQHDMPRFEIRVVMNNRCGESDFEELESYIAREFTKILRYKVISVVTRVASIDPEPGHHKVPLVVSRPGRNV
mgnify:FL=1